MKLALWSIPLPWIAIELGWIVAEYGRQPWTISEVLPTHLSVSSVVDRRRLVQPRRIRRVLHRAAGRRDVPDVQVRAPRSLEPRHRPVPLRRAVADRMIYVFDYATLKVIWWADRRPAARRLRASSTASTSAWARCCRSSARTDDERRVVLNAVGPTWEGNQVWFITAGGATFAAWPLVYATAFSGFYIALILTLFALFLRPVGFDYRSKVADPRWRSAWDWGLFVGGTVPALVFGVAFGNLLARRAVPFRRRPARVLHRVVRRPAQPVRPHGRRRERRDADDARRLLSCSCAPRAPCRRARSVPRASPASIFIVAFAAAGYWIATGIDGYQIVTMPPPDSAFVPRGEDRRAPARRLAAQLREAPVDGRRAARGLRRRAAGARRLGAAPRGARVRAVLRGRRRRGADRRLRAVSVHHAVVERSGEQPHGLGCGVEPPHAAGDVLGRA